MLRGLLTGRAPISGVALVLALLLSLLVAAPAHAVNGTLSGTLTGPDGDLYDKGFKVEVFQADGDHWQLAASQTVWSGSVFAVSLPPGSYRACFSATVDAWAEEAGQRCWSDGYDVRGATDILITDGSTTTIDPSLPKEAKVVRGRIVGPGGVGIQAFVAPYRQLPNGTWEWRGGVQSDPADGTFALRDLDPGTYRFCLLDVPRDYVSECWEEVANLGDAQDVTLEPGNVSALHFRLARKAAISGTVTRPPGSTEPMSVIAYHLRFGQWAFAEAAGVAPDGSYRIGALQAEAYRVCVNGYDVIGTCWQQGSDPAQASDIVLTATQQRAGIDLAPGPAGFVSGTLPDVYLGAQGYPSVTAWRQVGDTWAGVGGGEAVQTGIGSDWTYEIGSLPSGTYVVCVEHSEPEFVTAFPRTCNGGSPSPQGGVPFEVVAGTTTSGIDIDTGQAGEIRGGVSGAPGRVRVDLYAPTGRLALSQWTGPNNRYRFGELPAGDYRVGFHRAVARTSLAAEWWHNRGDGLGLSGATPVPVDGDVVEGIRATLDEGGTIDGRLLDSAGEPVHGCTIQARARNRSLAVRTAISDATGAFSIGGLSTASYVVLVPKACSGEPSGIFYDTGSPDGTTSRLRHADDVAVTRGQTADLGVDLHTSG
ncbi:carboxypeptidase regulatory-like domain-containing protein [Nocardioides sp. HM23]|uniref:carboxypeptidase regulatory-like domain-containing protein n=1 Tax=Nocardioides bizhenqiangii TaxID=3095076 RepID=UPI002ACA1603|nr:carboxypeptidase regulatory-like domain-containing protein [Nocardioides sp. HM23]MDZ5620278.1 carboxypeptidase regulatory-like domain-containing protein [Nocardioides sp. HM23]